MGVQVSPPAQNVKKNCPATCSFLSVAIRNLEVLLWCGRFLVLGGRSDVFDFAKLRRVRPFGATQNHEAGEEANTWSFRKAGARRREEGSRNFLAGKYL